MNTEQGVTRDGIDEMWMTNVIGGGSEVEEGGGTGSGSEHSSGGESRGNDGGMSDIEMGKVDDARRTKEEEETGMIIVVKVNGMSRSGRRGGSSALVARISLWSWTSCLEQVRDPCKVLMRGCAFRDTKMRSDDVVGDSEGSTNSKILILCSHNAFGTI